MERPELRNLPPVGRVLGAGFLVSLSLAYAVALLFVFVQTEMRPEGISRQYRGGAPAASAPAAPAAEEEGGSAEVTADPFDSEGPAALGEEWKARDQGMKFPKSLKDMILTTHLHMLSISAILFLVGGLFACSSFPERAKPWVIGAGFAGLILTYGSMWAVRYGSPAFGPAVFLAGLLQALSLATQIGASLKDLFLPTRR